MTRGILKSYRVFPGKYRKVWFWVRVFTDESHMLAWYEKVRGHREEFQAATIQWKSWSLRKSRWHRTGNLGEILLCWEHLKIGIIAHECFHAAVWFARITGMRIERIACRWDSKLVKGASVKSTRYRDTEENFARVIERLTAQIVKGAPFKKRV